MTTKTTQPIQGTYNAARAGIEELRAIATEVLKQGFHGIAEAARRDDAQDVRLRLKRRNVLEDLINAAAWLANDLVGVLLKIAADDEPHPVMASDLSQRIREAEIRLELLREMNRQ